MFRMMLLSLGGLALSLGACDSDDAAGGGAPVNDGSSDSGAAVTWSGSVRDALVEGCEGCHGGGISVQFMRDETTLDIDAVHPSCAGETVAACIVVRVLDGTMPIGKGCEQTPDAVGCPTAEDMDLLEAWAAAGYPK